MRTRTTLSIRFKVSRTSRDKSQRIAEAADELEQPAVLPLEPNGQHRRPSCPDQPAGEGVPVSVDRPAERLARGRDGATRER